uniref:(California timema) hypothetical protein n=1 Tax=Timema californicum TaxID=61474 RepID=A0A7R9PEQ9_TIMCA|nr:unnamed protein product [Timema californicum]
MIALLLLATLVAPTIQAPVNVTVFYESLCPDSIRFITQQLYPTWTQLTSEYLAVDFVPYGKAQQTVSAEGEWNFTCQHGPNECVGNIVQGQEVSRTGGQEVSKTGEQQMEFINCVMGSEDPSTGGEQVSRTGGQDSRRIVVQEDSRTGVQEDSRTGVQEDSRTGGYEDRRIVGQEDSKTGGQEVRRLVGQEVSRTVG